MVPAQGPCGISVGEIEAVADPEMVLPEITGEIQVIFLAELVIGL